MLDGKHNKFLVNYKEGLQTQVLAKEGSRNKDGEMELQVCLIRVAAVMRC